MLTAALRRAVAIRSDRCDPALRPGQPAWPIALRSMATVVAAAARSASSPVARTRSSSSTTAACSTPTRTGTLCIAVSTAAACSAGVAVEACGMRVEIPRPSARSRGG